AVVNVTEKYKKVAVSPLAATTSIFKRPPDKKRYYIFMIISPAEVYLEGLIDMAAKRGLKTVAILNEDTLFAKAAANGAAEIAKKKGLQVVFQEGYPKGNQDFSAILTKIRAANPDVVAGSTYFDDAVAITRQMRELNVKQNAEYIYGATQWEAALPYPGNNEFNEAYKKEFGREPVYHSAAGYAGCQVYFEAVKRAGTLDADKVRDVLLKLEMKTAFGDYKVDQDGFQVAHKMVMTQWQDGKKVLVWPDELAITPTMFGQVVISGILAGALYAMVALGLALIFGVMRVINIAHGPLLMLGAYTTYFLYAGLGLNPYLSVPVSMAVLFVIGAVLQRTLVFRVVDAPELSSLLLTFGISIALVNLAQLAFTSDLRVSKTRVLAFVFAAGVTTLAFLLLQRTRLGKAIRATSQSREVAMVCGVNVGRIHTITFGLASALAAAGGALIAVVVAVQPEMGQVWTFKSFLVIVLGGAGNYPGALLGGVLLGLVEQIASLFLTSQLSEVVAYVLLVVVLLVRPTGLLGGRQT
ncbi:MAG: hypothetical protein HW381_1966, partial [Candidatus Rokubacteria bacterium]|nr:hypothetical protein [Candidatus Rokubacteria bacterium]